MARLERILAPVRARRFSEQSLLAELGAFSIDELWDRLAQRPYVATTQRPSPRGYDSLCPGDRDRVIAAAEQVVERRVDLLGSGPTRLGRPVDWHADFKTGYRWPPAYASSISYNNLDRPSDVKVPWELSRFQWVIPAGQGYILTGDERYAHASRELVEEWIEANPYAGSVNWACTMDVALRLITWTWLFQAFKSSQAWSDPDFRSRFLIACYLHGDYTQRNLERSDVNGNHYTADAAGLVFAGLFFGDARRPSAWQRTGWQILSQELPKQVSEDGVDFEASSAYHRLVAELFLLPALYRVRLGLDVPSAYSGRLVAMARFSVTYCRADGTAPLWGDADDARTLPLGGADINDHRYLPGIVGAALGTEDLLESFSGPRSEVLWLLGEDKAALLPARAAAIGGSRRFPQAGVFVMRSLTDHVFIDCGPVGLAGRGGHGHNDCLSFEAYLCGTSVITDCGAYLYTASAVWRNRFRSTQAHNTPCVDGQEQNRFVHPEALWSLCNDAVPAVRRWESAEERDIFEGEHSGYRRLSSPVTPRRTLALEKSAHRLLVWDRFDGEGSHDLRIPYHFPPDARIGTLATGRIEFEVAGKRFFMVWENPRDWTARLVQGFVSRSYGAKDPAWCLELSHSGPLIDVVVAIGPRGKEIADVRSWARSVEA